MGILFFMRAGFQIARTRFRAKNKGTNFEEFARHTYGKLMAERFLLNYSQRLWGLPCSELSPKIGGYKLRGLNITTFLIEVIRGRTAKVKYLGGTIYYPDRGFGTIAERLSEVCGARNVRTNCRVTAVFHDNFRIRAIELNGSTIENTDEVVSTLPLNVLTQLMRPKLPEKVLTVAESLHFRALVLVVIFLKRPSVTESSSIHFPDLQVPFTRLHEPKNRSKSMAPDGQTSLVAEMPCQEGDEIWNMQDEELVSRVVTGLQKVQLITDGEIIDGMVVRLDNAYPVLDVNFERKIEQIRACLDKFSNLKLTGRTGAFAYLSLHHIMKLAKSTVASYMPDKGDESETA
jgi:protoporphyrinogen oxidase